MRIDPLIEMAKAAGASDLHLEPGFPPVIRVQGQLSRVGEPISGEELLRITRELLRTELWNGFIERRSADLARNLGGVRCRINAFCTSRGVGLAIRLLVPFQASVERLNLHPDLKRIAQAHHGLVVVSGPTGSGKSSTLAALIEEVNQTERRHIVTIESPIEYALTPKLSFIRQREVGRDTPSFEQALRDAMREDPDLLMVGEARDPETMRLTLSAAETGHLVLTTLHSATAAEALARMVAAFPAEIQSSICAQIAESIVAVVCQRLRWWPQQGLRAPECEILLGTTPIRAIIRSGQFHKLATGLETGGFDGCWTFSRYGEWMAKRSDWYTPPARSSVRSEQTHDLQTDPISSPSVEGLVASPPANRRPQPRHRRSSLETASSSEGGVMAIDDAEEDLDSLLNELEQT